MVVLSRFGKFYVARSHPPVCVDFSTGLMTHECPYCKALRFGKENTNRCHNGKVKLSPLGQYSNKLKDLRMAMNFKENIRQYNSAMAFASFGANIKRPPANKIYIGLW